MTLNELEWPFYVKFSLLRTAISEIILLYFCKPICRNFFVTRDQQRCAEADRDPQKQNIWDPRKDMRMFHGPNVADATSSEP